MSTVATMMDRVFVPDDAPGVNVDERERLISVGAGVGLLVSALHASPLRLLLLGGVAAGLIYRGLSGHCHVYAALGMDTTHPEGISCRRCD